MDFVQQQGLQVVNFTTSSIKTLAKLAHELDWAWTACVLCAVALLCGLLYVLCGRLPDPRRAAYAALRQVEEDWEVTAAAKAEIQILVDVVLLVIDIVLDIKVGVYYCSQGLWLFGPLALVIPGLAGLICFVYKRWSWRLGKDADCMLRSVDDRGRAKPGLLVLLRQVFQVEALATAYQAHEDPEQHGREWLVERAFNGVLEAFPQCLLQTYTLMCLEQEGLLKDPVDTGFQAVSIAFSCYSMAKALGHMSFDLLPQKAVPPLSAGLAGWQLQLLQFADVASRLLCWVCLGAAVRTPSDSMHENSQFALPALPGQSPTSPCEFATIHGRLSSFQVYYPVKSIVFHLQQTLFPTAFVCICVSHTSRNM